MPTYSYVCKSCAHAFDAQHSIHDEALKTCPECKGELRKVLGEVGVTFKGSGFYRTDKATPKTD
jgi:putative FmdB family regulatory protein